MGKQEIKVSETFDGPFPEFHQRYIDDILGAASMSTENLDRFINLLLHDFFSCISKDVIYCIECTEYVNRFISR